MRMVIISLIKGSGKLSKVREKSVKSQGILILSGNPEFNHLSIPVKTLASAHFCRLTGAFVDRQCLFGLCFNVPVNSYRHSETVC